MTHLLGRFLGLSRRTKRSLLVIADLIVAQVAIYSALMLRYGTLNPENVPSFGWPLFFAVLCISAVAAFGLRLDRVKLQSVEGRAVGNIAAFAILAAVGVSAFFHMTALPGPRSVPIIFAAFCFFGAAGYRLLALQIFQSFATGDSRKRVIIYGAGAAGIQLASALRAAAEARPMAFIDNNPNLRGLIIAGLDVHAPGRLRDLARKMKAEQVLIAIPSLEKPQLAKLVQEVRDVGLEVQVLPSYIDMMSGVVSTPQHRTVVPEELLGRDAVDLAHHEIDDAYEGRSIMVTGAGGSIGSELCRQLMNCKPKRIVLFERSEFALYSIDQDLKKLAAKRGIEIIPVLGSVTNKMRVSWAIAQYDVQVVLHAAAYKHVPLVEANELEGGRNNILGTMVVADAAIEAQIERFILVSTDKAVRPTNIMGATKRMAELVVQDRHTRSGRTVFSMVRFGNVLGSSGSVIPLFQKQIAAGGPVTVTDPEVTRYFMTIPEAARLVLLAGAYSEGGDVFVLDMGKPHKIIEIAKRMINLSGRSVKDVETGVGDIEIVTTGLRPGEKLFEELLIDNDTLGSTPHPKILRAQEYALSQEQVREMLNELGRCIRENIPHEFRNLVAHTVREYRPWKDVSKPTRSEDTERKDEARLSS
ncbi:NDP-sugar epimerase, includes UDP-GlcNAc-inverting 4,6-dehydratase FlaA1 and capsular polysaccharide biosynthesis protein EpsC [Roseivivax lentus]|uniref:NDP-sugar epimerase, includes UDP-GlcNAc-inverting 4,6-dehydratase FlaA1 and capsular polysaccharide biosynthesis protein EpsC n=1 Tax=Roseivivax lentus TaxID=633194 RepID=A0A1N7P638_9RHOB|nr:nucleoside-diphosphate sugar epimerase/dehydratase [Roseivivax lentus]SIT06020.1 NDP-sugar epimerase, includes UDP-GlcNAc-inverting 4,6-dehydratase FlaA1 and capsular polysaccharide biosynthesis protein EpsC [Roseivivax lentus]